MEEKHGTLADRNRKLAVLALARRQGCCFARLPMELICEVFGHLPKPKHHLNFILLGHVDCGKSTLGGHLIYEMGGVDRHIIDKYEKEAAELGRTSFKYTWVLDRLRVERERALTIDISMMTFEAPGSYMTIIDAPGHRDFVKNLITGASQADAALLVVSAEMGGFEAGYAKYGMTREHALLAFTVGLKHLVVCITKMDDRSVMWSKARYDEITEELRRCLRKIGYNTDKVHFIPASGWTGDNLVTESTSMPWYHGPTVLQALDSLPEQQRPVDRPLRLPIRDVYKITGVGTVLAGRIQTGALCRGMRVVFAPTGVTAEVGSIEMHHQYLLNAGPGDDVGFHAKGLASTDVRRGFVCGDPSADPPSDVTEFIAHVIVLNHPSSISAGYQPVVDCHTAHVACRFAELLQKVDRRSGKAVEDNPKSLKYGDAALVRIVPVKPLCVEAFASYAPLGRFSVRDMRMVVAVGVVKSVTRRGQSPGAAPKQESVAKAQ